MTRPSLRLVHSGKPRTPSNVEIHAFVKDLEAEEKAERDKEKRDQLWTVFAFAALIKLILMVYPW